jgi:hypothetical protein
METTAITVITPIITPIRVRIDLSLLATSDLRATPMLSRNCNFSSVQNNSLEVWSANL